jgi:hypothetical protein
MLENHQRFWQKIRSNSVIEPSSIARYNGNITRKEKLHGKRKRI